MPACNLKFWDILLVVSAEAYDALDPTGNITIKWDVISWTQDGYVVSITEGSGVHSLLHDKKLITYLQKSK